MPEKWYTIKEKKMGPNSFLSEQTSTEKAGTNILTELPFFQVYPFFLRIWAQYAEKSS